MVRARSLIDSGYAELPQYRFVLRDLLTIGVAAYTEDIRKVRGWGTRVLGLLQEARQVLPIVTRHAKGRARLVEALAAQRLMEARQQNTLPLGLDATERKQWSRQQLQVQEADVFDWEQLVGELRSFIDNIEDTRQDLLAAKHDLKAQLWAVRLHGVLGELSREGQADDQAFATAGAGSTALPPPGNLALDTEITALLQGTSGNGTGK